MIHSQQNVIIERFLTQDAADIDTTIYLAMMAGNHYAGDDVTGARTAFEEQFRSPRFQYGYLSAGDFSLIIGQTMGFRRGIMSTLFPTARYRFRDLRSYGIIPDGVSQSDRLTGEGVLMLIGNAIAFQEQYK